MRFADGPKSWHANENSCKGYKAFNYFNYSAVLSHNKYVLNQKTNNFNNSFLLSRLKSQTLSLILKVGKFYYLPKSNIFSLIKAVCFVFSNSEGIFFNWKRLLVQINRDIKFQNSDL